MSTINAIERSVKIGGITLGLRMEPVKRYVGTVKAEVDTHKIVQVPDYRDGTKYSLILRRN